MIEININSKSFGEKKILENIEITLQDGEFLSIVGPSGCGKSTFLNIICGLDEDYDGNTNIDIDSIGMMFQEPRLFPWLNVKDNISLIQKQKDDKLILELLMLVGLEKEINTYPNKLSGGMARRVSLVRAFINKPKLILLDEAFISLDTPTALSLKEDFLKFCEAFNPTVILVTHDLSEAISISDNVLFFGNNPTSMILKYSNDRAFFNDLTSSNIDVIKNDILDKYPNILKGEI